jgi:hypothetical protein
MSTNRLTPYTYRAASLRLALLQSYHTGRPTVSQYQTHAGYSKGEFLLAWPSDAAVAMRCLVRTCAVVCQQCKITTVKNYGKIPLPTHHKLEPWEEIDVDLISPWDVRFNSTNIPGKSTVEKIHALTVIDKTTGLPKFIAIKNKTIHNIALLFDSEWLCHYPGPAKVVYDNWHQVHRSGIPGITGKLQHKTGPNNREKSQEQQSHQESTPHHG